MKFCITFLLSLLASMMFVSGCSSFSAAEKQKGCAFDIVQSRFLGSLWNESHAKASIVSQDGGQSFVVPGGAIWAFGDTFKGSRSADGTPHFEGGAVSCSLAFLAEKAKIYPPAFAYLVSSSGEANSPFEYFPDESRERHRIWPLGGISVNGHCYLYYSLIEVFGRGQWDFRGVGSGLARSKIALGSYERLRPGGDWRFPVEPSQALEAEGWIYLFGIKEFGGKQGVTLARVRPERIEDPDSYEFYTGVGPKFSPQKEASSVLVENVAGQVSVAWNGYLEKYVLAASSDFSKPREIRFHVADAPYGPWSRPVARIEIPKYRQGKRVDLVYCTYLHPELFWENGRVMNLTYSLGLHEGGFDENCEMVEIELGRQK
jgi:hypothetical protein